ncbi:unnamed protein product [Acanthoscelides obtectus]|uniref:Uncharacterized protein n=1 Tax=Acanthoscelides obtectus TaxID=200917 RepID=A0A9P0NTF1_ACAOB|nr:unnamed protein product [Acanthoscelides obtectus]CAK1672904.1 hypothetical protein AOBTE_LOCUS29136 [Acanthoscelides obtectus]
MTKRQDISSRRSEMRN